MKRIIYIAFFLCVLSLPLMAKRQTMELKPIEQMGKPFNAFGGLKLDSMTYFNNNDELAFESKATKYVYEYSRDGRVNIKAYYDSYDEVNQMWIGHNKDEYTYLPGGNIIYKKYGWDNITLDWTLNRQVNDNYDSEEHNTSTTYFEWDSSTNSLAISNKEEYEYDSFDNIVLVTTFVWSNSKWVNSQKVSYEYDTNKNMTSAVTTKWNNNAWTNESYITQTFNESNQLIKRTAYQWNSSKAWVPLVEFNYVYVTSGAASGKIYTESQWIWDSSQDDFVANAKTKYTYDENGYLQVEISQEPAVGYLWNTTSTETYERDSHGNVLSYIWESVSAGPILHYEYTYDNRNNRLSTTTYDWDNSSETWIKSQVTRYSYDENNNLLSIASFDDKNEQTNITTYYYSPSNYCPIDMDWDYMYTWNDAFPKQWYSGDSIAIVTKINNNSNEPFKGDIALQLINEEDEEISQYVDFLSMKDSIIKPYNYQFVRFEGKINVPHGNYLVYLMYRESSFGEWKLAGVTDGHFNPDTFVVSGIDLNEYYIVAKRPSGNYYFFTPEKVSGKNRLVAVDAGTSIRSDIDTIHTSEDYLWKYEDNKLKNHNGQYLSCTAAKSAVMNNTGISLTKTDNSDGTVTFTHEASETETWYFSLGLSGYDYFVFYANANQITHMLMLPKGKDSTTETFIIKSSPQAQKILRNGQILIQRGEKTYTLQGQEVIVP